MPVRHDLRLVSGGALPLPAVALAGDSADIGVFPSCAISRSSVPSTDR